MSASNSEIAPSGTISQTWDRLRKFEDFLESLSEKTSSLVVKEARQALKSKQFTLTFFLLLICAAGWTMIGIVFAGSSNRYESEGAIVMLGYYAILSVPLIVIVPFSAFRSLAAEREDGTFELLSITTLTARQIVLGKLAASVMQMGVYYSALAPCIAFTYLLRGIDFLTIALFLAYLFLLSVLLCAASLLVAVVTKAKHWQILFSVALVAGLILLFFGWIGLMFEILEDFQRGRAFADSEFWLVQLGMLLLHPQFVWLFVLAASGCIGFTSENRSTPIRWTLLSITATWVGWIVYIAVNEQQFVLIIGTIFALIAWTIFGALLIGERGELTPRMRRALPQTFVGRALLTWLNPGSGTGYMLTILTYGSVCAFFSIVGFTTDLLSLHPQQFRLFSTWGLAIFGAVSTSYLATYLGIVRLIVLALRDRVEDTVSLAFALMIVVLAAGILTPLAIQMTFFNDYGYSLQYSVLQVSNPLWSLIELEPLLAGNNVRSYEVLAACWMLCPSASVIFLVNFLGAVREVAQTRLAAPDRLLAEDAARAAANAPPPKKKSPWEDSEWNSSAHTNGEEK